MATPYMNLSLPTVSATIGPTYATMNNAAFTAIDSHNHTTGQGLAVPASGLNINADLPHGGFNATGLRTTRFNDQGSALSGLNDAGCVYIAGGNLYYNNGAGIAIQLTSGSGLNAASVGGFGGDYGISTASAFYTNASKLFNFQSNTAPATWAALSTGSLTINDVTAGVTKGVKLQSPAGLAAAYTLTFPAALPAATSVLSVDTGGNVATGLAVPFSSVDGTAANPAFSFSGETGSGLYRIGAGDLGISVLGSKRLELTGTVFTNVGTMSTGDVTLTSATGKLSVNTTNTSANIYGNRSAADSTGPDVNAVATANRSAGDIFGVWNNSGVTLLTAVTYQGFIRYQTVTNPASSTAFTNIITPKNSVKAWAFLTCGGAGAVTVNDGFNVTSAAYSGTTLTVTLASSFTGGPNWAVAVNIKTLAGTFGGLAASDHSSSANAVAIVGYKPGSPSPASWQSGDVLEFLAVGTQ